MHPLLILAVAADSSAAFVAKLDSASVVNSAHAAAGSVASQVIGLLLPGLDHGVASFLAGVVALVVGSGVAFGWSHMARAIHSKSEADTQARLAALPWPLINSVGSFLVAFLMGHNPTLAALAAVLHLPAISPSVLTKTTAAGLAASKAGMALIVAGC